MIYVIKVRCLQHTSPVTISSQYTFYTKYTFVNYTIVVLIQCKKYSNFLRNVMEAMCPMVVIGTSIPFSHCV